MCFHLALPFFSLGDTLETKSVAAIIDIFGRDATPQKFMEGRQQLSALGFAGSVWEGGSAIDSAIGAILTRSPCNLYHRRVCCTPTCVADTVKL